MQRVIIALAVAVLLLALSAASALASPATATGHRNQSAPVKLSADLECDPGGGANVTFSVRNLGKRTTLTLENDFHLFLDMVGPGGREPVVAAFVFPAPAFVVIAPGGVKTFRVPMGTSEPGDPGVDLSAARRLLLEAEVFFEGRDKPVRRLFSFEGCAA